MNTTAVEQFADFGLRTFPVFFGLQNEAFERLQKLARLNLAALKASLDEAQSALSSSQSGLMPLSELAALSQPFFERALSYAQHVQEIDLQFRAAVTRAGEALHDQYNAIWTQFSANLEQTAPFGSEAAFGAMQSAIAAMVCSAGTVPATGKRTTGTDAHSALPDVA
jgi:phasin family protein